MKKIRRAGIILLLLLVAAVMDTLLFVLKKAKGIRFFPGG
jgi:hypothetical protein